MKTRNFRGMCWHEYIGSIQILRSLDFLDYLFEYLFNYLFKINRFLPREGF